MRFCSIVLSAVGAGMILAGCQSAMTPDAGQATGPVATTSAPASGPAMGRGGRGGQAAPANLEGAMSEMNRMLTQLKQNATDPAQKDAVIRNISIFARDVAISKLQTPPWVNRIANAEEKAKALESYRSMMNGLTRVLLDLEDAVNAKKADDIKKNLTTLEEMEKAGHQEFHVGND
jgi:hypothetical protein